MNIEQVPIGNDSMESQEKPMSLSERIKNNVLGGREAQEGINEMGEVGEHVYGHVIRNLLAHFGGFSNSLEDWTDDDKKNFEESLALAKRFEAIPLDVVGDLKKMSIEEFNEKYEIGNTYRVESILDRLEEYLKKS